MPPTKALRNTRIDDFAHLITVAGQCGASKVCRLNARGAFLPLKTQKTPGSFFNTRKEEKVAESDHALVAGKSTSHAKNQASLPNIDSR